MSQRGVFKKGRGARDLSHVDLIIHHHTVRQFTTCAEGFLPGGGGGGGAGFGAGFGSGFGSTLGGGGGGGG